MRIPIHARTLMLLACLFSFALILISTAKGAQSDVAIIVNFNNSVSNITLAELRKIYLGERQYWKANSPVLLLMRARGSRERAVILQDVFQMSEEQYTQYWVAKVMRAESSDSPAALFSHGMIQQGVKGNEGAIGYVDINDVRPGVKVLRINGLLPGEPGYPLH